MAKRDEVRRERYGELIRLGFTPKEARRLRDRSGDNIQAEIKQERRRIVKKSVSKRAPIEQRKLAAIRERDSRLTVTQRSQRLEPKTVRSKNFSKWSNKYGEGFPADRQLEIEAFNERAGKSKYDKFGYRMYYYRYVERVPVGEAMIFAQSGGSDIEGVDRKMTRIRRMRRRRAA